MVNIKKYQEAYESVVAKLKNNSQILAIVVYGSIVSGDIWENSDIDFLTITKEQNKMESIYTKVNNIPAHVNYVSKDIFISSYKNLLKGGTFHKAFFTGKLVYCCDDDIKDIHQSTRFYGDRDRDIRNIEIVCHLINSIHYMKKYLNTNKLETSFQWCVEVLKNYSRLLMNMNGHITDKDVLSFAVNMNSNVEELVRILNSDLKINDKIIEILNHVEDYLNINLEIVSTPVIELLKEKRFPLSVQDIQNSSELKQIDGDINLLLERLSSSDLIKEGSRRYSTYGDEFLIDEIVYFVD